MCVNFPNSMQILIHRSTFMYRLLGFASKNTKHFIILSKTKDSTDDILSLYYPWVFTHGCQTSGSPRNTGNSVEMEKIGFCVICMGVLSNTNYFLQLFPVV